VLSEDVKQAKPNVLFRHEFSCMVLMVEFVRTYEKSNFQNA
jgi:hypothetical protein